ncbi:hypothetical protein B0O99DRAFT_747923 [Bisporella sp. PMI_857]|nr:hypothetical protein B0O99DRAFT_747923 [Bisporella sp. PMI_857]
MEYQPAINIELDFLSFGDDASMDTDAGTPDMASLNEQTTTFQDPNAALSNMFKTGLTPLGFTDEIPNIMPRYNSWEDLGSLKEPHGYLPKISQPEHQTAIAPSIVEPSGIIDQVTPPTVSEAPELLAKPKRGRPRKSRAKKQLSAQQEHEKRQKFLERNRQAATKCRERRKNWISKLNEKVKQEQAKNAKLKAEYDILSQEPHKLLHILHQHAEGGCDKNELQAFLRSESILGLASLKVSGQLVRRFSDASKSSGDHKSVQNSLTTTHKLGEMSRQNSQCSDAKDSTITNIGLPVWRTGEVANEGFADDGNMVMHQLTINNHRCQI